MHNREDRHGEIHALRDADPAGHRVWMGVVLVDPYGDLLERVLAHLPKTEKAFTTLSPVICPPSRKNHISLILTHQHPSQLDPQVKDAILGNTGTIISFRLGLPDAELLVKEFHPIFSVYDLINLPNFHIYLKLMIDGVVSNPFSAVTLVPLE